MRLTNVKEVETAIYKMAEARAVIAAHEAEMNKQINRLKEEFDKKTARQRGIIDNILPDVEAFCIKNKLLFQKTKSLDFPSGKVGFRITPPKVSLLNRKYNLKTALELIKRLFDGNYVRVKEEIDKDGILADYSGKRLTDDQLAGVGLKIDQDENFFVDLKWEEIKVDQ